MYNVFRENRRLLFRKGLGKRRDTGVHYESYLLGATHEVTGSCTLIECGNNRGLVDCGMEQGKDIFENQKLPVAAGEIDFVLLTHAHIDHSGNLPLLFKTGSTAPFTPHARRAISAASCCVTARTFRRARPSGATAKPPLRRTGV